VIPKAEVMAVAEESQLLPTTIEKDYALGWFLFGMARHPELRRWIFKGGTCLKKCYFDTYRFSEDLDFTLPEDVPYERGAIAAALGSLATWVLDATGIQVPERGISVEERTNKRGEITFEARVSFRGPIAHEGSAPRIKFDLTKFELVASETPQRAVSHGSSDAPDPSPSVRCYSLEELLAEKVRALAERFGRARDVYDVVSLRRTTAVGVDLAKARDLTVRKFAYKGLAASTPEMILAAIDWAVVAGDWDSSLRHQLPALPPVDEFQTALGEALAWLLVPERVAPPLPVIPGRAGESAVRAVAFGRPSLGWGRRLGPAVGTAPAGVYGSAMDRVRYAARNRLRARITYDGVPRLVEPYSLRMPKTGNLLLYVYEVQRGSGPGGGIKAFKVAELGGAEVTSHAFQPRFAIEL